MVYDLRREAWLPFRCRSGEIVWGPPSALTARIDRDPAVALAAPRPDFNGALLEFLIGLLTVALAPEDEAAWRQLWRNPPPPERLQEALDALPPAFDLDGDGPRFLQDIDSDEVFDKEPNGIEALLIDAAGEQTAKFNKDLFVKRDRIDTLGRPAAAMALITLQTYAPAGGQGNRTSMRGGGPLTTLIEPRVSDAANASAADARADAFPLWQKIWANVETRSQWLARGPDGADLDLDAVFPWLARTRISDPKRQGRSTSPQDAHPLQAYFGIPRRIRLAFEFREGHCDLTGRTDSALVSGFHSRNYGVQYEAWLHPLTPYYKDKDDNWLPIHGQPGGIAWKDWAGLLFGVADQGKRPAQCVAQFLERRGEGIKVRYPRLHVIGYDMDNMKARGWVESELPAFATEEQAQIKLRSEIAAHLTEAARAVEIALVFAVKSAWFSRAEDAKGDFSYVKSRFWAGTQESFFRAMERAAQGGISAELEVRRAFQTPLEMAALAIFDSLCPADGFEFGDMRRLVSARHNLCGVFKGFGKFGGRLFAALGLAAPQTSKQFRNKKEATG